VAKKLTAAQKAAAAKAAAGTSNAIPAFNQNTLFQTEEYDNPNFTGWATYISKSGNRVAVWRKNGKIDPQNKGDVYYVLKNGNWYNSVNNKAIKATGPVIDSGVAPLTGKSWQQIADEKDAATPPMGVSPITSDPNKSPTEIPEVDEDTDITLLETERDEYDNLIGIYSNGTTKILIPSNRKYKTTVDEDAYEILRLTFKEYGLDDDELLKEIQGYMERGLGSERAGLELKKTKAYTTRFSGNEARRAAGLNVMSEAAYLELEDAYSETLRAYGLQGYFGTDRKKAQAKMGELIGNDIAAPEFKERIDTVAMRVNNADPNVKATLKAFYNIEDTDLVKYFLNPKENLPKLQEKVTAAEIGNEALKQNLITGVTSAENLAKLGITQKDAREGYSTISQILPTASKLGQIYSEEKINYTQATAEEERFGELDSARRKRLRLAEKEIGTFSGSSGVSRGALGSSNSGKF